MIRVISIVVLSFSCTVAYAQTNGQTGTAGGDAGIESSDFGGQGIQTGPTEQTESGFASPEASGFAGPGDTGGAFRTRSFTGGQTRQITTGGNTSTQRQVRPRFRLGFVPSAAFMARSRQRAVSSFNTIVPRVRTLSGVSIMPQDNGSVTLTGRADSRYDQLLAAAIARLQPGVKRIRNDIRVAPTMPAPQRAVSPARQPEILVPQQPIQNPPEIITNPTPAPLQPSAPVRSSVQPPGSVIINPPVPPEPINTPRR